MTLAPLHSKKNTPNTPQLRGLSVQNHHQNTWRSRPRRCGDDHDNLFALIPFTDDPRRSGVVPGADNPDTLRGVNSLAVARIFLSGTSYPNRNAQSPRRCGDEPSRKSLTSISSSSSRSRGNDHDDLFGLIPFTDDPRRSGVVPGADNPDTLRGVDSLVVARIIRILLYESRQRVCIPRSGGDIPSQARRREDSRARPAVAGMPPTL